VSGAGNDRGRRLAFAVPPIEPESLDIDTSLLDPADPDDRALLITAAHPELDIDEETAVIADRRDQSAAAPDAPRDRRHAARRR
jgi:hypothetical protein